MQFYSLKYSSTSVPVDMHRNAHISNISKHKHYKEPKGLLAFECINKIFIGSYYKILLNSEN